MDSEEAKKFVGYIFGFLKVHIGIPPEFGLKIASMGAGQVSPVIGLTGVYLAFRISSISLDFWSTT